MADKLKDGISRELRYMEYKLRKKLAERDKKKAKKVQARYPGIPMSDESTSYGLQPTIEPVGGEDLQSQVALSMSREEAKNKEAASDKICLERALKESAEAAAKATAKAASVQIAPPARQRPTATPVAENISVAQDKLLMFDSFTDINASAPNSSAPVVDAFGTGNTSWGSTPINASVNYTTPSASNDIWGNQISTAGQNTSAVTAMTTSNNEDLWSSFESSRAPNTQLVASDFESGFSAPNDAWNSSAPPTSFNTTPVIFTNNTLFSSFPQHNVTAVNSNNTAGVPFSTLDQTTMQPVQSFQTSTNSADQDFFSGVLMPQSASTSSPFAAGANASQALTSQFTSSSPPITTDVGINQLLNKEKIEKAEAFLGENAALVNMNKLIGRHYNLSPQSSSINSCLLPETGTSNNPFRQKRPSLSLNQMKGTNNQALPAQSSPAPPQHTPAVMQPGTYLPPVRPSMSNTIGMPLQPSMQPLNSMYGQTAMNYNPLAALQPSPTNPFTDSHTSHNPSQF